MKQSCPSTFLCAFSLGIVLCLAASGVARAQATPPPNEHPGRAVHILGFVDAPKNLKCTLVVDGAALKLKAKGHDQEVPLTSVEDVLTGADSVRAVGGALGTISMLGPYGSGRFLSLFRKKTSTLSVEYRDAAGGFHGAVFSLDQGQAEPLKKQLVAAGAHTSVPIDDTPPAAAKPAPGGAK
jgi:hypothetical protein